MQTPIFPSDVSQQALFFSILKRKMQDKETSTAKCLLFPQKKHPYSLCKLKEPLPPPPKKKKKKHNKTNITPDVSPQNFQNLWQCYLKKQKPHHEMLSWVAKHGRRLPAVQLLCAAPTSAPYLSQEKGNGPRE